jgi:type II secretion system protein D
VAALANAAGNISDILQTILGGLRKDCRLFQSRRLCVRAIVEHCWTATMKMTQYTCHPKLKTRNPIRVLRTVLFAAWLLSLGIGIVNAAPPAESFQAYRLSHSQAVQVGAKINELLATKQLTAEVIIDKQQNRLLVRGDAKTCEFIDQVIQVLDTPPASSKTARNPTSIAMPTGSSDEPATRGNAAGQARPSNPNIRLVADQQTIQQDRKIIPLRQTSTEQVEQSLARLVGRPLTTNPNNANEAHFRLEGRQGGRTDLMVQRRERQVVVEGDAPLVDAWVRILAGMDQDSQNKKHQTQLLPVKESTSPAMRRAVAALEKDSADPRRTPRSTAQVAPAPQGAQAQNPPAVEKQPADNENKADEEADNDLDAGQFVGPVQIEFVEGLDVIVVRGHPKDVARVSQIINDIDKLSTETEPEVEIIPLQHVGSDAAAALVRNLYTEVLSSRQGAISITPLSKPNAILVVGRADGLKVVKDVLKKLDQPVPPDTQYKVFPLKNANATSIVSTVREFFANRTGLGPRITVTADSRANSLIVQAGPRDMEEVGSLINKLDLATTDSVNELRFFPLQHAIAEEMSQVLQRAILGVSATTQSQPQNPFGFFGGGQQNTQSSSSSSSGRTMAFQIDLGGAERLVRSGILSDVRITPDARANMLIVSAPHDSMDLIGTLIKQLDTLPQAEAKIKVFAIKNGDAQGLLQVLQGLFNRAGGAAGAQGGGGGGGAAGGFGGAFGAQQAVPGGAAAQGEDSIVQLRFSVDQRTNTLVASGAPGDLDVVEAILMRLDDPDARQRKTVVYRLKNTYAPNVSDAFNNLLRSEVQLQQRTPQQVSPFEQIEQEVVVVPEISTNSLIVSATPRYFEEIKRVIEQLDVRPPMVMIQVLIAEVDLNNTDEFGIELGLQSSVLFDRSLLSNPVFQTKTNTVGTTQVTNQELIAATNTPGFAFNNQALGNSISQSSSDTRGIVAGQGISNFAVGRVNNDLGFGGLVLSASSDAVSALLRALQEKRRTDVLARPQVMALDNQPAFIQVGQVVPMISNSTLTQFGQQNSVQPTNVGLILSVRPRISVDNLVTMEVDAVKSEVGPESEGIPITITTSGQVVRSPRINTTQAQTTISAADGQTIVLGGLMSKSIAQIHRRVPVLSDVPVLGHLFRFDSVSAKKTELLIIMTPHIVRTEEQANCIKQTETARMSWCMCDVVKLHGDVGLRSRCDEFQNHETNTYFPDVDPTGQTPTYVQPGDVPLGTQIMDASPTMQQPIYSTPNSPLLTPEPVPTPQPAPGIAPSPLKLSPPEFPDASNGPPTPVAPVGNASSVLQPTSVKLASGTTAGQQQTKSRPNNGRSSYVPTAR